MPANIVDELNTPLLLIHGGEDHVVDVEHFQRLKTALDAAGKTVDAELIPDLKHSFTTTEQARYFHHKLLGFLEQQLDQ